MNLEDTPKLTRNVLSAATPTNHPGGERSTVIDIEITAPEQPQVKVQTPGDFPRKLKEVSFARADVAARMEHFPIIVFGIARINETKLTASLSGLKLEGKISGLQTSLHYREKLRTPYKGLVEV